MAGNNRRKRIGTQRLPHGPRSTGCVQSRGHLTISGGLPRLERTRKGIDPRMKLRHGEFIKRNLLQCGQGREAIGLSQICRAKLVHIAHITQDTQRGIFSGHISPAPIQPGVCSRQQTLHTRYGLQRKHRHL